MTARTITVKDRYVYGKRTFYPACDDAHRFAEVAGTRTLTLSALSVIGRLGYEVKIEAPEPLPT